MSFGFPIRIDHGNAIGRVDVVMIDAENAVISWMEPNGVDTLIQIVKVSSKGVKSLPITIAKTRSERSSGFPQMELLGDKLYVAWTSMVEEEPTIEIATVLMTNL